MHKVKQNLPFLQTRILHPHGTTPCTAKVKIKVLKNRWIFKITAPQKWLTIPFGKSNDRRDFLWQSTCLECFIFDRDSENYVEYNFSPNGAWALYAFDSYRKNAENPQSPPPQIFVKKNAPFSKRAARRLGIFWNSHNPKILPALWKRPTSLLRGFKKQKRRIFLFRRTPFQRNARFSLFSTVNLKFFWKKLFVDRGFSQIIKKAWIFGF